MVKEKNIRFGTDGWRAVIAKDFTFENLGIVTQATGLWIKEENITGNGVIIGYDTRFMGREFAEFSACILAAMGIPVRISNSVCTTPAVSWAAFKHDAIGIAITASHNSPIYNGFKIKATYGGSAMADQIEEVEQRLSKTDRELVPDSFSNMTRNGSVWEIDLPDHYLNAIRKKIDIYSIKKSRIRIAHDSMYGSGQSLFRRLLGDQVMEIHAELNPGFHGMVPEPTARYLTELSRYVIDNQCDIGLATDGDGERIGLFDENGTFVSSHLIMALLTKYLARKKGLKGSVVKSFSTTHLLNKQAESYGLMIETTPVGFKYIADKMVNSTVIIGGEESGGIAVAGHLPERDGIYIGLLMIEMMIKSGVRLSRLVQDLFDEFGPHYNSRNDIPVSEEKAAAMLAYCRKHSIRNINGIRVIGREFIDGVKMYLEDGSWILVRASGTENVLRIYCESESAEKSQHLADSVSGLVDSSIILEHA